jgi:hypothetical protein
LRPPVAYGIHQYAVERLLKSGIFIQEVCASRADQDEQKQKGAEDRHSI